MKGERNPTRVSGVILSNCEGSLLFPHAFSATKLGFGFLFVFGFEHCCSMLIRNDFFAGFDPVGVYTRLMRKLFGSNLVSLGKDS